MKVVWYQLTSGRFGLYHLDPRCLNLIRADGRLVVWDDSLGLPILNGYGRWTENLHPCDACVGIREVIP